MANLYSQMRTVSDYSNSRLDRFWDKLKTVIANGLEKGWEELTRSTKIGRCQLEISGIKNSIDSLYKELGREVYSLWQLKKISAPQMEDILNKINLLEEEIKHKEALIEAVIQEREAQMAEEVERPKPGKTAGDVLSGGQEVYPADVPPNKNNVKSVRFGSIR